VFPVHSLGFLGDRSLVVVAVFHRVLLDLHKRFLVGKKNRVDAPGDCAYRPTVGQPSVAFATAAAWPPRRESRPPISATTLPRFR
jgi:hypothetical protein